MNIKQRAPLHPAASVAAVAGCDVPLGGDHPSSVGGVHAQRGGDGVNVGGGSLEVVVCANGMIVPAS